MEILSHIEYKETWLYMCMYKEYELHNIVKERFYGHCTQKKNIVDIINMMMIMGLKLNSFSHFS